ncbi:facilitated trehalose transporter Tret1-2 homolog isoform X2 [Ceratina calcarata]|uniref:Facilitated trehalose transporter Tret1-2 homolog isoform X2 n=1 Tax=Ceratina calcarata TaxID=156304 RepID=A0AAJ7IWA1_9HYME|nr:facilitated trehalose transporter Tret1-2 homolog isoform X2 [Ceratina calcarata]
MAPPEREECHYSILGSNANYANVITPRRESVCENVDNNNTDGKSNSLENKQESGHYSSNSKGVFAQCLVSGSVLLLAAGGGMPIGYSAILLPQLAKENGTMHVDSDLGSWIASVHSLATPIGSLTSGPLLDAIGRRGSLQFSGVPLFLGWFFMGFARNIPCLLVGRIILGFGVGLMAVPSQVLLGEMSDPRLRGTMTAGVLAFYCFGILLVYGLGASFNWDIVAFCSAALPLAALISLILIPESPAWLIKKKRSEKARKALLWLRGGNEKQVESEMLIMEAREKADQARTAINLSFCERITSAITTLGDPSVFKPLMIINIFNVFQLMSGTYIVVFYAVDIVHDTCGDSINTYLAAVITAAIRLLFSSVSSVLLLKMGRRSVGLLSALGTSITSLTLAVYMMINDESSMDIYVVGMFLLLYVAISTMGLMMLPGLMMAELLPLRARGIGGGSNFFLFNFFIFVSTKLFPTVKDAIGIIGVFSIFGTSAFLEAIFIYLVLPETKNCTLQEIEDYFQVRTF